MHLATFTAAMSASLAALAFADFAPVTRSRSSDSSPARAVEVRRIQVHFDSVLAELPARDVSALSLAQQARRAAVLETLRAYRDRGVFPHNYDFPNQAVPYFVDRKTGTLCAVAHLLESTGRRDIVDRVARANNNILVPELAGDTAFAGWLESNGLTLAEAAFIQVPYMDGPPAVDLSKNQRSSGYTAGSIALMSGAAASGVWNAIANADGHSRVATTLGMATGVAAVALAAGGAGSRDASTSLVAGNVVAGGLSLLLSSRGLLRHRSIVSAQREAEKRRLASRTALSPIIPTGSKSGAGLVVSIKF
jgi:hypothetical protein